MEAENFVKNTLTGDPAVTVLCSNIQPVALENNPPAIVYKRTETAYNNTFTIGARVSAYATIEISCWGNNYDEAANLLNVVKPAMLSAGAEIANCKSEKDKDNGYYRLSADFKIMED